MGRLKPIIKPFDSEWNYILHLFFKLTPLIVNWLWKCNNLLKKKFTSLRTLVIKVCQTTLNIFPHWIYKPRIRKHKNHRITVKQAVTQEDLLKISVYTKSHNIMYKIVNLEDITNDTPLEIVTQDTDPHLPTFHIIVWMLKGEWKKILKLHLLVNNIEWSMQSSIITILLSRILQECYHLFYLLMNCPYVLITCSWIQNIILKYVYLTKLILISIC